MYHYIMDTQSCVETIKALLGLEETEEAAQLRIATLACISCILRSGDIGTCPIA